MRLFYRLATGFMVVGLYRIALHAGTLFVDELTSIVGKETANAAILGVTLATYVLFGLVVRVLVRVTE